MQENNFVQIEGDLRQIADMLLLNGTLTECPGLIHGKIGIAIFFFHYAKFTGNDLFADYAMDAISEVLNQIHIASPADYERGLAGIGVGFDYMIQNNFLSVEDDICEDFDQRMVRAVMYDPWLNFSQYCGLIGYGQYWITRLRYQAPAVLAQKCLSYIILQIDEKKQEIPIAEQADVFCFLSNLQRISGFNNCSGLLEQCRRIWDLQSPVFIRGIPRLKDSVVGNVVRVYQHHCYFHEPIQDKIDIALKQIPDLDMEKAPVGTGLLNGYTGEGMMRLTVLDRTNISWMNLL